MSDKSSKTMKSRRKWNEEISKSKRINLLGTHKNPKCILIQTDFFRVNKAKTDRTKGINR